MASDTMTMTFFLAPGKTQGGSARAVVPFGGKLWFEKKMILLNTKQEDMGIGFLLDDAGVLAADLSWVDDYNDTHEPMLVLTGLYYADERQRDALTPHRPAELQSRRVNAPYYQSGIQITEWIVKFMQENVYNQDVDADNRPDSLLKPKPTPPTT